MKIEMGESLFYSWLRHVKECQIVQTNWKTSPKWTLQHEEKLEEIMSVTKDFFKKKYGYLIYKKTASLSQLLQQAECDALGIAIQNGVNQIFAVDVAFHEDGLNYGNREQTVMKIIAKSLRTAMCIYGYLDVTEAEIIFASPKIYNRVLEDLAPCVVDMQRIMNDLGYHFRFRIISNQDFSELVLYPILMVSDGVADTTELFLRSYQMLTLFEKKSLSGAKEKKEEQDIGRGYHRDTYGELKIGQLVQIVMRRILEGRAVTDDELLRLRNKEYSRKVLHLNFPLLVKEQEEFDPARYYKEAVIIRGEKYMLCSQWSESPENNDRPYLIKWMEEHSSNNSD